jgi:hypothetical protein
MSDLKLSDVTFGNDYNVHNSNNGKLTHIVPIKTLDNKYMYFTTSEISTNDLICVNYKKPYNVYRIKLVIDLLNRINTNSEILINQLNQFKDDIVSKLKYMIRIPEYKNQLEYSLKVNTYNNMITDIIQYNNKSISIPYHILKNIIKTQKYKLLVHIQSIGITHDNVYLNLRMSRIIIDTLDTLNTSDKIYIYNTINSNSISNIKKLLELNKIYVKTYKSKKTIKNELYKLL